MLERLRRIRAVPAAYVLALLIALAISAYILAHEFVYKLYPGKATRLGESCPDPAAKQENPNTTLFVNCGGYLE